MAELWRRWRLLLLIAGVMVALQLVNSVSGYALNQWGLVPRRLDHLPGVLISPWLHAGWFHLFSNLPGLLLLGGLLLVRNRRDFIQASLVIIVGSGLLVWLLGRNAVHVGASGWLFGLWALLLGRAWFERRLSDLLIALVVLFMCSGWWFGLLPGQRAVSFEYHLAGAVCGLLWAGRHHFGRRLGRGKRRSTG